MATQTRPASRQKLSPRRHDQFVSMLPAIRRYASGQFRHQGREARSELVAEAVGLAFVMFVHLVRRGRAELAYPTPLARYAVRQVRDGRRVGCRLNISDITSRHCRKRKQVRIERLDRYDRHKGAWREAIVEDHRTPVADQAAFRCDFPSWLESLSVRDRKVAEALSAGESTGRVARTFRISSARISQLRRELHKKWFEFHGEPAGEPQAAAATA